MGERETRTKRNLNEGGVVDNTKHKTQNAERIHAGRYRYPGCWYSNVGIETHSTLYCGGNGIVQGGGVLCTLKGQQNAERYSSRNLNLDLRKNHRA